VSVLALSNVFAGTFIGTPTLEAGSEWPRYKVAFDVQARDGVKIEAYVVQYSKNRWTGEGFLYLPGRGDDPYWRNVSTILRDGQDGNGTTRQRHGAQPSARVFRETSRRWHDRDDLSGEGMDLRGASRSAIR
jgi:hypothetical protein